MLINVCLLCFLGKSFPFASEGQVYRIKAFVPGGCLVSIVLYFPILSWHSSFLLKSLLIVLKKFLVYVTFFNFIFFYCFQNSFCLPLRNLIITCAGKHLLIFNLLGILCVLWILWSFSLQISEASTAVSVHENPSSLSVFL